MAVFKRSKNGKRGKIWWYEFVFGGQRIRESSKSTSKMVAQAAERKRRRDLEEGYNGLKKPVQPQLFTVAAKNWLELKAATLAPRSVLIEKTNLGHIEPVIGRCLLTDITPERIGHYQQHRLREEASHKTINLEVATIRAILRRNKLWANIQQDVRMLPTRDDVGRAIDRGEEAALLKACLQSRSRSIYPAVVLTLNTGMRDSDVRLLTWGQIDFSARALTVGKAKTDYGTGRVIPLSRVALAAMTAWAAQFPSRKPEHYVFPSERYGASGDKFEAWAYKTDPTKAISSFKTAWQNAKREAGVKCRFHDLRHTACTRMLEAGQPFAVLAALMGWSPATTVRMAKRYGHIGQDARRQAVESISAIPESHQARENNSKKEVIQ